MQKVSICMPVYNGSNYLRSAIESALAQDYTNLEIIVVNDGSTDEGATEEIARSFGSRIRYFSQSNGGVAKALNTAVLNATGDYFTWLSHDDLYFPHKTKAQIEFLNQLGRMDACIFSDYDLIDSNDGLLTTVRLPIERLRTSPAIALMQGMINGCSLMIPMSAIRRHGPFDERLRYTQDYELWNKILDELEFFHQPEVLIRYRIHPSQDSQKSPTLKEVNTLWMGMVEKRTETQRAQLFGSSPRYFSKLAKFLSDAKVDEAAQYANNLGKALLSRSLTTVVIPFWNECELTCRAIRSALGQINANIEVIVVDDGSTEDITPVVELAETDSRVKLLRQRNLGPAAARNFALLEARGDYIAFLDADDFFLPNKVERQIQLMQEHGALFSHTSYYVSYPGECSGLGLWRSGNFGGACYPQIMSGCPIAMPTVMLHRSIIDEGFCFPVHTLIGEDVLAWVDLAMKYLLLGIDEPLSVVEWSHTSAALCQKKQAFAYAHLLPLFEQHPVHGRYVYQINEVRGALNQIAHRWVSQGEQFDAPHLGTNVSDMANIAWAKNADFTEARCGRLVLPQRI